MEDSMPKTPMMVTEEADLYKSGIYLFMDNVNAETCKEAIEFILKQNTERKRRKKLQFMI